MRLNTEGLVIREQNIGEADRLVTILTAGHGIIKAFARGARRIKSGSVASTQLLSYSSFSIYMGKERNVIDEAQAINVFFGVRGNMESLSLGQYFAELSEAVSPDSTDSKEILRTVLNSLYLLGKGRKNPRLIKAVAELRIMSAAGYMPDIVACKKCGSYEAPTMIFDAEKSALYCEKCMSGAGAPLPLAVITAMRHICYSEQEKIFSFSLPDVEMKLLSELAERYMLLRINKRLPTLEFYKTISSM